MRGRFLTLGLCSCLGSIACSPGPGRPPIFADAEPDAGAEDAGFEDAAEIDVGFVDAGPSDSAIGLPDTGPVESYPFSGVFLINGAIERLYAREMSDGQLSLIVDDHPLVYTGTIDQNGNVDVRSDILERSGCATAQITGVYERATGFYSLRHQSCSVNLDPFDVMMFGQLVLDPAEDFDNLLSGIYELDATIMANIGCYGEGSGPFRLIYAVNILPGQQTLYIYTADDLLSTPDAYIGSMNPSVREFSTILRNQINPSNADVQLSGRIEQLSLSDPPRLIAQQDVWDNDKQCGFSLVLDGVRTSLY